MADRRISPPPAARGRFLLGQGTALTDGQTVQRVLGYARTPDGRPGVVVETETGQRHISYAELCARALETRSVQSALSAVLVEPQTSDWLALPEKERRRVLRRVRHLLQVQTGSPDGDPERARRLGRLDLSYDPVATSRADRVKNKSQELGGLQEKGASQRSIYRDLATLVSHGMGGLAHKSHGAPLTLVGVDPVVLDVLRGFLESQSAAARISVKKLLVKARRALQDRDLGEDLSRYKLQQILGELSRGMAMHREARSRETHANKPVRLYSRLAVSRPGEIVQIDATDTVVHVWDPDLGWVKTVILSAICVYTRCVVAFRVCTVAVTGRDVAMLLWDIGKPVVCRAGWPYELDRWHGMPTTVNINAAPADGAGPPGLPEQIGVKPAAIPSLVVFDHGSENDSISIAAVCAGAGIDVLFCPPRAPHAKGVVEAYHNFLREAQSPLDAYKGANPMNHPKGVESQAVLTPQDLRDCLWEAIIGIYHKSPHEGLDDREHPVFRSSPEMIFDQYMETGGYVEVPQDPYRLLAHLPGTPAALNDYGIRLNRRIYNSDELIGLRSYFQRGSSTKARQVIAYYDRWDVTRIYLRHPQTKQWICVPQATPGGTAVRPFSELITEQAREAYLSGKTKPLTDDEIHEAEVRLLARWSSGAVTDRKELRYRAVEQSRQRQLAHDLSTSSEELRRLAYPDAYHWDAPHQFLDTGLSDDDEILEYDEDVLGGLAL
ncbi:MAG: Mu transposase C-terminal domain-containing protein [Nocardioidaceae bacterium]